jgi:transposase
VKPFKAPARAKKLDGLDDWLRERFLRHRGNADVVRQDLAAEKNIHVHLRTVERAVQPYRQALRAEALATVRFETPPGRQLQIDFARFVTTFTDEPGATRIVWLFSMVLGHSRFIFAHFVMHQDLQTLLRCYMQAFAAIGGVPIEILYDRMKTAVTGEDGNGHVVYNTGSVHFATRAAMRSWALSSSAWISASVVSG